MSGVNKEEDAAGETLEEAGKLEADVGANFDQQLAGIDPRLQINMDPFAHRDLRPEMMFIREELRQAKWQTLAKYWEFSGGLNLGWGLHAYLYKFLTGEGEVYQGKEEWKKWEKVVVAQVRRTALKKLLLKDFMMEDCELRNIGLAYAPPDP